MDHGHYVAYVKKSDQWYELDDSNCTEANDSHKLEEHLQLAYYFLYIEEKLVRGKVESARSFLKPLMETRAQQRERKSDRNQECERLGDDEADKPGIKKRRNRSPENRR